MGYRVLAVDDESLIREALTLFVQYLGLEISCAATGEECIEEFERAHESYDLVLVNYDMPGMDGPEVVRRLRQLDPEKPIALTSAYPEEQVFRAMPADQVDGYLKKPYNLAKIRNFLHDRLPNSEPCVITLLQAGKLTRDLLSALEQEFSVKACTLPNEVLQAAKCGLANVVLWDLEDDAKSSNALHTLRSEGIPVVFLGSPGEKPHPGSSGLVLPRDVSSSVLADSIRRANGTP